LTGESVPAKKDAESNLQADIPLGDRENTAFSGTTVSYGRGKGVVISTGMHTQLGLIATMLQSVEQEQTPLQKRLEELGKTLGIAALIVCALVFVIGVFRVLTRDMIGFGLLNSGMKLWRSLWSLYRWRLLPSRKGCLLLLPSALLVACAKW
jgi:Ca2+-transporting ATPase